MNRSIDREGSTKKDEKPMESGLFVSVFVLSSWMPHRTVLQTFSNQATPFEATKALYSLGTMNLHHNQAAFTIGPRPFFCSIIATPFISIDYNRKMFNAPST